MMELLQEFLTTPAHFIKAYALPFLIVLTVLVFIHEWGHYIIARLCGVRVEVFSIGLGPEIFGKTDRAGTRWKFSWVPLGGYVQMFGDTDPASAGYDKTRTFTAEEKKVAFYAQPVGKRAAIVFAGPAINFIFAIFVMAGLFMIQGQPYTPPVVGKLVAGSPAEKAGIRVDDKIIEIDGQPMKRFQELYHVENMTLVGDLTSALVMAYHEWGGVGTPQIGIVDWVHKDDVQREMRRLIKRQLKAAGYVPEQVDAMAASVVDLLKRRGAR